MIFRDRVGTVPNAGQTIQKLAATSPTMANSADQLANLPGTELLSQRSACQYQVRSHRASILIDAACYFAVLREVIPRSRHSIFIVGWDIDSRMELVPGGETDGLPAGLADFLCAVVDANPDLRVYVLGWDFAMLYAFEREWLPAYQPGWRTRRRLSFRLDGRHPLGGSHHQKCVVIDDSLAFTGGIDLTRSRWDRPAHTLDDPQRKDFGKAPYQPTHDVQIMFDGPAAAALGQIVRARWQRSRRGGKPPPAAHPVLSSISLWPARISPDFVEIELGIALTEAAYDGRPAIHQVKALHLAAVNAARSSIYIENQYFTAGAVGTALRDRLIEPDGPDVALICPFRQSGWLQDATMGVLRARLHGLIKAAAPGGRYVMYAPTADSRHGGFINVHSKLMIVDERVLLIGSANLNNRSMVLDSECCVVIDAQDDPRGQAAMARIRNRLLAEHLGVGETDVARALHQHRRLNAAIASLRGGYAALWPNLRVQPPSP